MELLIIYFFSQEPANVTVDNVLVPEHNEKGKEKKGNN
jgi:hypothetical protein